MARPPKKSQEQWRSEIIKAAQELFLSKGYDNTSITDIMNLTGGAKGASGPEPIRQGAGGHESAGGFNP